MATFQEVVEQLVQRIEELEYEVSESRLDGDGQRVYVYEYPIPNDFVMFTPSDTYNAPDLELSITHELRYT